VVDKPGDASVFYEATVPKPQIGARDVLVSIRAVSVNPIDYKLRGGAYGGIKATRILGFDGAGVVVETGAHAHLFKNGDEVYFSGSMHRNGTNAEFCAVDERLIALKPKRLNWAEAASIPLVTLTAGEGLQEVLGLRSFAPGKSILVIGAAGGVGGAVVQLAKKLHRLTVIGTASRPESRQKVLEWGADHVIDHANLKEDLAKIGFQDGVDYIFNCADFDSYLAVISEVIKPLGKAVGIVSCQKAVAPEVLRAFFLKRATFSWEFMFCKSMHGVDMESQGKLLQEVAMLIDQKVLDHQLSKTLNFWTDLPEAHRALETGKTIGKIALTL